VIVFKNPGSRFSESNQSAATGARCGHKCYRENYLKWRAVLLHDDFGPALAFKLPLYPSPVVVF
jgi:hypothetical protein